MKKLSTVLAIALVYQLWILPAVADESTTAVTEKAAPAAAAETASQNTFSMPEPPKPSWRYKFTQAQYDLLKDAGCMFTTEDMAVANRLARRGFTVEQYLAAYFSLSESGFVEPSKVEAKAVMRFLNFSQEQWTSFETYGGSVTEFHNKVYHGGLSQRIGGWVTVGVGASVLLAGVQLLILGATDKTNFDADKTEILGGVVMGLGGMTSIVGGVIVNQGNKRTNQWAPDDILDSGHIRDLARYKIEQKFSQLPDEEDNPRTHAMYLVPAVSPDGGGLVFGFSF
jgi:hypothetical protein